MVDGGMKSRRNPRSAQWPRYALRGLGLVLFLTGLGLWASRGERASPVRAQEAVNEAPKPAAAPPPVGHLISIPLPVAGNSDQSVRAQIRRVLNNRRAANEAAVIVLEFGTSEEQTGVGSEFGRCYELARFLLSDELRTVRTVAYIPYRLQGHALLVAMACQEINMRRGAELGHAGHEGTRIDDVARQGYEWVYSQRNTLPAAVAMGIIDPKLQVYRAKLKDGTRWFLADKLEEVKQDPSYFGHDTIIDSKKGEPAQFAAEELRTKYEFISRVVADRADLATALKLAKLSDDPSLGGKWNAIRVDLDGPIDAHHVSQMQRAIEDKMRAAEGAGKPVNFICLHIESQGGTVPDGVALMSALENLGRDDIYVSAYIPSMALANAAIVAMACDSITMAPEARLGGSGAAVIEGKEAKDLVTRIQEMAKAQGDRWSLWAAMIDRDVVVYQYTREGTTQVAHFSPKELAEQRDKDQWVAGPEFDSAQTLLGLKGTQAHELGLVDHIAASYPEYLHHFGIEDQPELVRSSWVHVVVEALRNNLVPPLLIFLGGFALIAELSTPGVGIAGFIAVICFTLFFWLQVLNGTASGLEILLFIVGIGCIAIELFILPGFGIFGLGGGIMVIASLVLASQTFVLPRNEYQLEQLPYSLLTVVAAGTGVFAGVFVMRRYADTAPGLRSMMLAPPTGEEQELVRQRESLANFTHLHGKRGTTATPLVPAGKARFGDDLVDVMSRGDFVTKGLDVIVVEVQGNVVIVEPVE
jgi:membrane-bound ClpP family serine protease